MNVIKLVEQIADPELPSPFFGEDYGTMVSLTLSELEALVQLIIDTNTPTNPKETHSVNPSEK